MAGLAYALANRLNFTDVSVQTAAGDVVMVNEGVAVVNKGTGAATQVTLPPHAGNGGLFPIVFVVDGKGDAQTHNITVVPSGSDTINGGSSHVINTNFGCSAFVWDGSQWVVLFG